MFPEHISQTIIKISRGDFMTQEQFFGRVRKIGLDEEILWPQIQAFIITRDIAFKEC